MPQTTDLHMDPGIVGVPREAGANSFVVWENAARLLADTPEILPASVLGAKLP